MRELRWMVVGEDVSARSDADLVRLEQGLGDQEVGCRTRFPYGREMLADPSFRVSQLVRVPQHREIPLRALAESTVGRVRRHEEEAELHAGTFREARGATYRARHVRVANGGRRCQHLRVIELTLASRLDAEYTRAGGPWWNQTLDRLLVEAPADVQLLWTERGTLTGAELQRIVPEVAGGLRALGVGRHEPVVWQVRDRVTSMVLYWAVWWLGAVAVPLADQVTAKETASLLATLGDAAVVSMADSIIGSSFDAHVLDAEDPLGELRGQQVPSADSAPGDPAVVLTTAGSSGVAKYVVHTHRTLAHKSRQLPELHGTGIGDVVLVPAQLAHMAGLMHGVMHPVVAGVKAVVMTRWDPARALELIREHRVSMLFGPPVFTLGISEAPGFGPDAVESVRLIVAGGTTITTDFARTTAERFDAVVKRTYGSTEAPIVTNTFPGDPAERGLTSDGRVVPDAVLEVRDLATGAVLRDGTVGELWVRGAGVAEGYLDPEQTREAFVDGWFRTRDLAVLEDGWLTAGGRTGDIIIRGGANISVLEVEQALERHPLVRQAVVVGFPDDRYGERVGAFVVAHDLVDRSTFVEWFATSGVAKSKVPDRVIVVDSIPVLPSYQKPDRQELRRRLAEDADGATR
jgi:cyclohexanecarboxylate-CoA ligase